MHRQRLLEHGFLETAIKGWLISSSPNTPPGDTTPWFSSFWEFLGRYCDHRFGDEWHLSAPLSLDLHAEKSEIPAQVVVNSVHAQNNKLTLPYGTSLFGVKLNSPAPEGDLMMWRGLRVFRPEAALVRVTEAYYRRSPTEAEVVLTAIDEPSELLRRLLEGGHSTVAGRLAGALRRVGRADAADEILSTMRATGHDVRESDPFDHDRPMMPVRLSPAPPLTRRLQRLWASGRQAVLDHFPPPPKVLEPPEAYLATIDDIYEHDAYHSLSIEGYRVSPELIERVASGDWDRSGDANRADRDALAARGYFQAFALVRDSVARVYGQNDPSFVRAAHRDWYRELFAPSVVAGLIEASDLAGYRNNAVFLRGSRHMPPRWTLLRYAMPAVFDLIDEEPHPAVRAILAHWLMGYVHPFPDGNGRIARFSMNALFATVGYPWTVIRVQDRARYLDTLEQASVGGDLVPFVVFIAEQMRWSASQTE